MNLGVRWTIGDVSARGWEALRLSVHCAVRLFGPDAAYCICVNTVPLALAREKAGPLPGAVEWREVTAAEIPAWLAPHLDSEMAEGVGWKLLPLHVFAGRHELALDNDCILWQQPAALQAWLASGDRTLMAEDCDRCLGHFQNAAVEGHINSGIRGVPPAFALGSALRAVLDAESAALGQPLMLRSELDEQGLQAVALGLERPSLIVSRQEVTICSPFWPREPELGTCGAHFVGLNSRHLPWNYYDRPADLVRREHFDRHRPALYRHAGLPMPAPLPLDG